MYKVTIEHLEKGEMKHVATGLLVSGSDTPTTVTYRTVFYRRTNKDDVPVAEGIVLHWPRRVPNPWKLLESALIFAGPVKTKKRRRK